MLFRAPGPKPGLYTQIPARPRVERSRRAGPSMQVPRAGTEDSRLASMEGTSIRPGYELWRPNRQKAQSKTTKALVALVLLVSAGLLILITIGGWPRLESPGM